MNLRSKALARLLLVTSAATLLHACDKASPVAPSGTTVSLSANPSQVSSTTGTSTITAIVRKANGTPVVRGTEVRFATNLGTIDTIAETDSDGFARVTLRGDGRQGTATVVANVGGTGTTAPPAGGSGGSGGSGGGGGTISSSGGSSSVQVEIGLASGSIVLQPSPTNIQSGGGDISLVALVRDSRGQPLPGAGVNFLTEIGRLTSGGRLISTDANGQARDTLRLTDADVASVRGTAFTVTAQTSKPDGSLLEDSSQIQVDNGLPVASFTVDSAGNWEVAFTNTSTPRGADFNYLWTFGDGQTSTARSPLHAYPETDAEYTVTLRITLPGVGDDTESKRIRVERNTVNEL